MLSYEIEHDEEGNEMVPLRPNRGEQYAEQATPKQRVLLAKLAREDGINPVHLSVRSKSEARMILNFWLRGKGPLRGYGKRDGRVVLFEIQPRMAPVG